LLDSLRAQPQFTGVALSNNSLMAGTTSMISFDPSTLGVQDKQTQHGSGSVSPGFFETWECVFCAGAFLMIADVKGATQVIIINESAARRLFPGKSRSAKQSGFGHDPSDQYQIAGLAPDTRDISLQAQPRLQVYFPLLQDPSGSLNILVRTVAEPSASIVYLTARSPP